MVTPGALMLLVCKKLQPGIKLKAGRVTRNELQIKMSCGQTSHPLVNCKNTLENPALKIQMCERNMTIFHHQWGYEAKIYWTCSHARKTQAQGQTLQQRTYFTLLFARTEPLLQESSKQTHH